VLTLRKRRLLLKLATVLTPGPSKRRLLLKQPLKLATVLTLRKRGLPLKLATVLTPQKKNAASKAHYFNSPEKKKAASCAYSKKSYAKTLQQRSSQHKHTMPTSKKAGVLTEEPSMVEPKREVQEQYVKEILGHLLIKSEARVQLIAAFKRQQKTKMPRVMRKAVCRVAAKRLLNKLLPTHREYVGSLFKACRLIKSLKIDGKEDFEDCHTASTDPYYYNTAYKLVKRDYALPIDENGKCVVANEILSEDDGKHPMKWECSSECKPLMETEVDAIVSLRAAFENSMQEVRHALEMVVLTSTTLRWSQGSL